MCFFRGTIGGLDGPFGGKSEQKSLEETYLGRTRGSEGASVSTNA